MGGICLRRRDRRARARLGAHATAGAVRQSRLRRRRRRNSVRRLPVVVPSEPVSALAVLDDVADVLLHSRRHHGRGHRRRLSLAAEARRDDEVEPDAAAGPDIALHLLDSRRDGVRPHFAAAAQTSVVDAVVDRARDLLRLHARMFDVEGPVGRIEKEETGGRRRKTGGRSCCSRLAARNLQQRTASREPRFTEPRTPSPEPRTPNPAPTPPASPPSDPLRRRGAPVSRTPRVRSQRGAR